MSTKKLSKILEKELGEMSFGLLIRSYRKLIGKTQVELAKDLDIARGTMCDIEKGRQLVSIELAVKIANKLKLPKKLAVEACLQDQINRAKLSYQIKVTA